MLVDASKIRVGGTVRIIAGVDSQRKLVRLTGTIREIKNKTTNVFVCKIIETNTTETFWMETGVSVRGPAFGWVEPLKESCVSTLSESEIKYMLEDAQMACRAFDNPEFAKIQQRVFAHIPGYNTDAPPDKGGSYQRMILVRDMICECADAGKHAHPIPWFAQMIHDYLCV